MFGLMRKSIYEDEIERIGKAFVQEMSDLREACQHEKTALHQQIEQTRYENVALAEQLAQTLRDTSHVILSSPDISLEDELDGLRERNAMLNREKATWQAERDEWQRQLEQASSLVEISTQQFATVQAQYEQLLLLYNGRVAEAKVAHICKAALDLLAWLREAQRKKTTTRDWVARFESLEQQYQALVSVMPEEAKEATNAGQE